MAGEGFADQADGARVNGFGRSSVGNAANGVPEPAALAQKTDQLAACLINFCQRVRVEPGGQDAAGPEFQFQRQRFVARLQKRPVKMAAVIDVQSPLNTGFCLAAKAL